MNAKPDIVYVQHILECIERIESYVDGERDTFLHTPMAQDAVIRNLQIMMESSQRISSDLKSAHPHIPWRTMSGFRSILTHNYLGVDLPIVWDVVSKEIPALKKYFGILRDLIRSDAP